VLEDVPADVRENDEYAIHAASMERLELPGHLLAQDLAGVLSPRTPPERE
jgi:hypothetical protein